MIITLPLKACTHAGIRWIRMRCPKCGKLTPCPGVMASLSLHGLLFNCFINSCRCGVNSVYPEIKELCVNCTSRVRCLLHPRPTEVQEMEG